MVKNEKLDAEFRCRAKHILSLLLCLIELCTKYDFVCMSLVGSRGNHLCGELLKGMIHINLIISEIPIAACHI